MLKEPFWFLEAVAKLRCGLEPWGSLDILLGFPGQTLYAMIKSRFENIFHDVKSFFFFLNITHFSSWCWSPPEWGTLDERRFKTPVLEIMCTVIMYSSEKGLLGVVVHVPAGRRL